METETSLVFITGGVRSGKSSFAEQKALQIRNELGGHLHYIATAQMTDEEMKKRINRHRQERNQVSNRWKTWEHPQNIHDISCFFQKEDIILLDCLTTLLNNELFLHENDWKNDIFQQEVKRKITKGIFRIAEHGKVLIVVSNEVVFESIPTSVVYTYSKLLGELHQIIVENSKQAYLVESSIPILMKDN